MTSHHPNGNGPLAGPTDPDAPRPEGDPTSCPEPPPPASSQAPKRRAKARTSKPRGLTPEQVQLVTSGYQAMRIYLCRGAEGLGHPDPSSLPSTSLDFEAAGYDTTADGQKLLRYGQWRPPQFAAYYWYLVSWHREQRAHSCGIPGAFQITLPLSWPQLIGRMKNLMATMSNEHLFHLIRVMVEPYAWAMVRHLIGPMAFFWELDEHTPGNVRVINAARTVLSRDSQWFDSELNRISEWAWARMMGNYPR